MEWLSNLLASPIPNLLIIAGLLFLGIAVVGNISGKIQPGSGGRFMSALLGLVLLGGGLWMNSTTPGPELDERVVPSGPPTEVDSSADVSISVNPTPAVFRIVEMFARADPFDYSGPCPVMITFSGRVSVAGGGGTVSYKWIRNDGASAPVETLIFDGPGSQDVSTTWYIGGAGMDYSGWQALEVFDPQSVTSDRAEFQIRCD